MGNAHSRRNTEMTLQERELHLAVLENQRSLVRALIADHVDVDCRWQPVSPQKTSALSSVTGSVWRETGVAGGSSLGSTANASRIGLTPLLSAVSFKYYDISKMLVEADACVNTSDKNGCTPLFKAAFHGHPSLIELLLKSGARVNLANCQGQTPLYICVHNSVVHTNSGAVRQLLSASANVDMTDSAGRAAIHVAAHWKRADILKELIDVGGNADLVDLGGRTPLYLCASLLSTVLYDADIILILPCLKLLHAAGVDMLNLAERLRQKGRGIPLHLLIDESDRNSVRAGSSSGTDTSGLPLARRAPGRHGNARAAAPREATFLQWYQESIRSPLSLKNLARKTIQTCVRRDDSFLADVKCLKLPKELQTYVSKKLFQTSRDPASNRDFL